MVAKSVPLPSGPVSLRSPRSPTGSESDAELETEGLGLRGEVNIGGGGLPKEALTRHPDRLATATRRVSFKP